MTNIDCLHLRYYGQRTRCYISQLFLEIQNQYTTKNIIDIVRLRKVDKLLCQYTGFSMQYKGNATCVC